MVESAGRLNLPGIDEWNQKLLVSGAFAPVHKPLVSAGEMTAKGNDLFFFGD